METRQFLIDNVIVQHITVLTDLLHSPNLVQKKVPSKEPSTEMEVILLTFAGLYNVIAIDRYLSSILKRLHASFYKRRFFFGSASVLPNFFMN